MNEVTKMSGYSRFKILFETNFRFEMRRKLEYRPRTRNGFFKRGRLTAAVFNLADMVLLDLFIYYNLMAVSKVKAIRTICKRVTATPYKNKSPYLR